MQRGLPSGGVHVAIIMDGNGRWATSRGRARSVGHAAGARTVRRIVEAAPTLGVGVLTLYAFSGDNWKRPAHEVEALMQLFRRYLAGETARCIANDVRLRVIGRRDRLAPALLRAIESAELATRAGTRLLLRIALDYSARDAIVHAAAASGPAGEESGSRDRFEERLARAIHDEVTRPVDLLIRTGGEMRLSDFMLWECAYAELFFTATLWPDFTPGELERVLRDFATRERRFGQLPAIAG